MITEARGTGGGASTVPLTDSDIDADTERRWPVIWWDAFVIAAALFMSLPGGIDVATGKATPGEAAWSLACLLAFGLLYLCLGRGVLRRAGTGLDPGRARSLAFLIGLILVLAISAAVNPAFATLQTLGFPMLWVVVPSHRQAIVWSAVLAVSVGCGSVVSYSAGGMKTALWTAGIVAVLSFAFAVAMGTWIMRIFERGEGYRAIAERLRQSQAEVAELSTQAGASIERERLSRELHDTLTQTLTGLVMLSEQAERALAGGDADRARERLERVQAASRAAVREARALVATTHPLGDGGLEQAVERVAESIREDSGLEVRCELERLPLDREQQVVLLRAAQEGLSNVRRHARAHTAVVSLRRDGSDAVLAVTDDGVGPAASGAPGASGTSDASGTSGISGIEPARQSGFGLSGLRERVRIAGGEASFSARDGGGSRLEVRLPLDGTGSAPDALAAGSAL